ncbi:MAG: GNAT family N-acetyltransferase [Acetobacteraceae bacterium]
MAATAPRLIRPLRPEDAEDAAALIRTAFAAIDVPLDPPPSALRLTGLDVRAHLQSGGGALHGNVGCVLWSVRDGGLYIGRLAVLPASRGQGIAAGLIARAEAEARDRGLPRLHLEVRLALAGNRRLFARAGFVEGARRAHPGFAYPTFVEAEKRLR